MRVVLLLLCALSLAVAAPPRLARAAAKPAAKPAAKTDGKPSAKPNAKPNAKIDPKDARSALFVADFTAPPAYAGLASEISRATAAALRAAGQPLRPSAGGAEHTLSGRIEVRDEQVRLYLRLRALAVEASGDLEHLDELVDDGVRQLLALLREPIEEPETPAKPETPNKPDTKPETPVKPDTKPDTRPETKTDTKPGTKPEPKKPDTKPPEPKKPEPKPPEVKKPDTKLPELPRPPVEHRPDLGTAPVETPPPPPPPPREVNVPLRVAVHIVGPPPRGQAPAEFYSVGYAAQQSLMNYLQTRLRVQAVTSPLVGLTVGSEALVQSQRRGTRVTLMMRFDRLFLTSSPPTLGFGQPTLHLQGRAHVVLLYDGVQRLDRTVELPMTNFVPTDSAEAVTARAVTVLMDVISAELSARLSELR